MTHAEYEKCYDDYSHLLYGRMLSRNVPQDMAMDVLQKTFVEYYTHCQNYDGTKLHCFSWLVQISEKILNNENTGHPVKVP